MSRVCFIVEGNYPYTVGSASEWLHQLIGGLPEIEFSIIHLHSGSGNSKPMYRLPANVVHFKPIPLNTDVKAAAFDPAAIVRDIPEADVYHALGSGFAGWVATEVKQRRGKPLMLTERNLFWQELETGQPFLAGGHDITSGRTAALHSRFAGEKWLNRFRNVARAAYRAADIITSNCVANRDAQLSLGAALERTRVIHDGVDIQHFQPAIRQADNGNSQQIHVGLIGRVSPMKDIKTFIRAARQVQEALPQTHFYIVGPSDGNDRYYSECVAMIEELRITGISFTGKANPADYYRFLDILAVTSISEGQPRAILEAMSCGIPVVGSDCGGGRELVYGPGVDDAPAGIICPTGNSTAIANAIIAIAADADRRRFGLAGRRRILKHYRREKVSEGYRALYQTLFDRAQQAHQPVAADPLP